jgi:sporulation-control protein spo0M
VKVSRYLLVVLVTLLVAAAIPAIAGPVPSKTAANQSLDSRAADLAVVKSITSIDGVSQALEAQGFSKDQVNSKISSLSDEDLRSLAQNLEQVEAAGMTREQWIWIGVGALAALLLVVLL